MAEIKWKFIFLKVLKTFMINCNLMPFRFLIKILLGIEIIQK